MPAPTQSPEPLEQTMQFFSACLPPLEDGDYKVTVSQKLTNLGQGHPDETLPDTTLDFTVAGPRFALDPADVHIVYPPPYQVLTFEGQLPHVVFSRKTLPWERLIGHKASPQEAIPWLALVLLHDTDFAGSPLEELPVVTGTVADLLNPPSGTFGPQDIILEFGEHASDPVQYIDIPRDLFSLILPRFDELKFLAHARKVEVVNKPTQSINADGIYSVLIGNRLPHESAKNSAFAVSVEGFEDYLPGGKPLPSSAQFVRLAVLYSWQFFMGGEDPFDALMTKARTGLLAIKSPNLFGSTFETIVPPTATPGSHSPDTFAQESVDYALQSGFAPLPHALREGGKTVSWFRGPLIPPNLPLGMPGGEYPNFEFADQNLRYDPDTGMFDATYAGAWQLGRLLALQSQAFAKSLRGYVQRTMQAARHLAAKKSLVDHFENLSHLDHSNAEEWDNAFAQHLNARLNPLKSAPNCQPCKHSLSAAAQIKQSAQSRSVPSPLHDHYSEASNIKQLLDSIPPPSSQIIEWLSELAMLYGVPFEYLVPNEAMLPMESVRYAYLDENWIARLLDGALSIGLISNTEIQKILYQTLVYTTILPSISTNVPTLRSKKIGARPEPTDNASPPQQYPLHWPLSTFLVRSSIIGSWKGIEVIASDEHGSPVNPLPHLRFDIIAPNVLLAIYNGRAAQITFRHPAENFHFGIDGYESKPRELKQAIRNLSTGTIIPTAAKADIALRTNYSPESDIGSGVLNISQTSGNIHQALIAAGQLGATSPFTVADFAIQMVESPEEVTFTFQYPQ